ncbi:uncharacterized protein LOC129317751 [Prosopis cineraria]|uniref:uncharacterized protein LOC129317751 n=1 Tax=Prosopis cineraria TaxID=364024 RepID=UPI00241034D0|nr:uncharacterized protein LOC129317751 [Prosopis cineraria]
MHIWPSSSIRDSFKFTYLNKLEWNLQRMKREKQQQKLQQSSINQNLLDEQNARDSDKADVSNSKPDGGILAFCHDLGIILSCCYCCFCCGACVGDK